MFFPPSHTRSFVFRRRAFSHARSRWLCCAPPLQWFGGASAQHRPPPLNLTVRGPFQCPCTAIQEADNTTLSPFPPFPRSTTPAQPPSLSPKQQPPTGVHRRVLELAARRPGRRLFGGHPGARRAGQQQRAPACAPCGLGCARRDGGPRRRAAGDRSSSSVGRGDRARLAARAVAGCRAPCRRRPSAPGRRAPARRGCRCARFWWRWWWRRHGRCRLGPCRPACASRGRHDGRRRLGFGVVVLVFFGRQRRRHVSSRRRARGPLCCLRPRVAARTSVGSDCDAADAGTGACVDGRRRRFRLLGPSCFPLAPLFDSSCSHLLLFLR